MPSKMEAPESAKTITVFVNGDSNYSGKKFVVNRKRTPTFDTLLGDVSTDIIIAQLDWIITVSITACKSHIDWLPSKLIKPYIYY